MLTISDYRHSIRSFWNWYFYRKLSALCIKTIYALSILKDSLLKFSFLHLSIFVRALCFIPTNEIELFNHHWLRRQIVNAIVFYHSSAVTNLSNQTCPSCGLKLAGAYKLMIACKHATGIFSKSTRLVFLHHKWNRIKPTLTDRFLVWKLHWIYCECSTYW